MAWLWRICSWTRASSPIVWGRRSPRQDFQAVASKEVTRKPLVVLTNRATSGAAEVAAAALLESKRAEVVGERTYGDAAIRKAVNLDDGSAVILSVAKFYGPDGKSIQDNAVVPSTPQIEAEVAADIDIDSTDASSAAAEKRSRPDPSKG